MEQAFTHFKLGGAGGFLGGITPLGKFGDPLAASGGKRHFFLGKVGAHHFTGDSKYFVWVEAFAIHSGWFIDGGEHESTEIVGFFQGELWGIAGRLPQTGTNGWGGLAPQNNCRQLPSRGKKSAAQE